MIEDIKKHLNERINKFYNGESNENSNGDFLIHCKNTTDCFDCLDLEDSKYCYSIK